MSIAYGNRTSSNQNPGGSSQTLSVNCSSGADNGLFVVVTMASTTNFSSATYDGVPMTLVSNNSYGALSQRQASFWLSNPSTGTNTFKVNFTGNQWNVTSIHARSFTGISSSAPTQISDGLSNTPHSKNITTSSGGVIYLSGIGDNSQSFGYVINGSTRTNEFTHNVNKILEGAWSDLNLPAGSITCITKSDFGQITNNRWSFSEAVSTPTRRRIITV